MANIKAALKDIRQSEKHHIKNKIVISELKTLIRKYKDSISAKKKEEATTLLPALVKRLDMAATKKIIHPNNASRKKSRLMTQLAALK